MRPITGDDEDAWATQLRYADVEIKDALADVEQVRRSNFWLLARLPEADRGGRVCSTSLEPLHTISGFPSSSQFSRRLRFQSRSNHRALLGRETQSRPIRG